MPDTIVRPSVKLVKLTYWLSLLLAAAILAYSFVEGTPRNIRWLLLLPGLIVICAAFAHLARLFTKLTIGAERLRYEAGMLSKSTRTMELRKVQDVRNLSIETAGETSRMTITNIDQPNQVADTILNAAHQAAKAQSA